MLGENVDDPFEDFMDEDIGDDFYHVSEVYMNSMSEGAVNRVYDYMFEVQQIASHKSLKEQVRMLRVN